jgi:mannitol-1-phosphate/altronate dehydrogenase
VAEERGTCLVFGAGALGLAFLGPELCGDYRMIFADIAGKSALLEGLRRGGQYRMNESGPARTVLDVGGVDAINVETEGERLAEAIREATLIFTAVGEPNLGKVAPTIMDALEGGEGTVRVLCCENGIHIARKMRAHLEAAGRGGGRWDLRVGDTVMGRMCQWVEPAEAPWVPLWDDAGAAAVGEPFYGMPVEAHVLEGLDGAGGALEPCGPERFSALEDLKMWAHNGLHGFLACLGALRARELFCELADDAELMRLARRLLREEVGPALLRRHAGALGSNEYANYATTIVRRILCPGLRDAIERGTRGALRKLAPWERFVSGVRCVLEEGGRPEVYCRGLAAAVRLARAQEKRGAALGVVLTEVCGLSPEADAELWALITEGDRWLDREWIESA